MHALCIYLTDTDAFVTLSLSIIVDPEVGPVIFGIGGGDYAMFPHDDNIMPCL